jgi:SAM-dependent methyltransferase
MQNSTDDFIYDSDLWGIGTISPQEKTLAGRKLSYCLESLGSVHGRVLEVGCARGQYIRSIKQNRPDLISFGCDINKTAISLNMKEDTETHYFWADATKIPFPDGSFDAIVFFDLLEHLTEPDVFFTEARRILKKGGTLHGYVPCEGQPGTLHWLLWKIKLGHDLKKKHRGHIQRFTHRDIHDLAKEHGFTIQNLFRSGYFFEQCLDLLFYIALEMRSSNQDLWNAHAKVNQAPTSGLERMKQKMLAFCRDMAFAVGYYETKLCFWFPISLSLHVTAERD